MIHYIKQIIHKYCRFYYKYDSIIDSIIIFCNHINKKTIQFL